MYSVVNRIKQGFKDMKIQAKIMAFFLPLVLIPLIAIGLLMNHLLSEKVLEKSIINISDNSELIIKQMERSIENAGHCANMLTIQLSRTILGHSEDPYGYLSLVNAINGEISRASVIFPEVESIAFVDQQRTIFSPNVWIASNQESDAFRSLMAQISRTNGVNLWLPMEPRTMMVADPGQLYLTIGKKVIDIQSGKQLGSLVLSIKGTTFAQVFKGLVESEERLYLVVDAQNRIVVSSDPKEQMQRVTDIGVVNLLSTQKTFNEITNFRAQQVLVTCKAFSKINWRLVTITPTRIIYQEIWQMGRVISLTVIFVSLLALWTSQILSKNLAKPIKTLKNAMKRVEAGDLETPHYNSNKDEIGSLSRSFELMRERILELIRQVNAEEAQKRQYELALISAQIKPHFLYNSLDAIYVLAQMERTSEVAEATKSLADFYRVALSDGAEEISLRNEMKSIQDYMTIQHMRYSDVFDYQIDLPPELDHCRILKMTLQPLVENAIYHGLKEQRSFGHLNIWAEPDPQGYAVFVQDNGQGMSEEVLKRILSKPEASSTLERHFGVYSVHKRLQLHYGPPYGVSITSELGQGTTAKVLLPGLKQLSEDSQAYMID